MKMDLSKVKIALTSIKDTFLKYPVSIIALLVGFVLFTVVQMQDYDIQNSANYYLLNMLILAAEAVFALSTMLNIYAYKFGLNKVLHYLLGLFAILLPIGLILYFVIPDVNSYSILHGSFTGNTLRILMVSGLSLSAIFIFPFLLDSDTNKWWNFFFNFVSSSLISILYALVIFLGFSLALGSLDVFWKIQFHTNQYAILGFLSFFFVTQLYVLTRVKDLKNEVITEIPAFLITLVKFVMIPLIIVYTAIIYPYIFSFPFRAEWPANQSTYLIFSILALMYSVAIISYGLKSDSKEKTFFEKFVLVFNYISLPAILFWAYSLYLRIAESGLTINRIVLASIILLFFVLGLVNIVKKLTDIRIFLTSVFVLLFIMYFMPFTSFYWAQKDQINRLVAQAEKESILKEGKIDSESVVNLPSQISSTLNYLNLNHTLLNTKEILSQTLIDKLEINEYGYAKTLTSYAYYEDENVENFTVYYTNLDAPIQVPENYNYFISKNYYKDTYYEVEGIPANLRKKILDNLDLSLDTFEIATEDSNDYEKHYYYSKGDYSTKDFNSMLFEYDGKVFFVTSLNIVREGGVMTDINSINGYEFTK
jgi:hypothetical protein